MVVTFMPLTNNWEAKLARWSSTRILTVTIDRHRSENQFGQISFPPYDSRQTAVRKTNWTNSKHVASKKFLSPNNFLILSVYFQINLQEKAGDTYKTLSLFLLSPFAIKYIFWKQWTISLLLASGYSNLPSCRLDKNSFSTTHFLLLTNLLFASFSQFRKSKVPSESCALIFQFHSLARSSALLIFHLLLSPSVLSS